MEFALAVGILLTLAVGTFDFGRSLSLGETASALSRTGYRAGATSPSGPIDTAIMGESKDANLSSVALTWGPLACPAAGPCGDTGGCTAAFFVTYPSANACFAVRSCLYFYPPVDPAHPCPQVDATWGYRPEQPGQPGGAVAEGCGPPCFSALFAGGRRAAIQVRVVIRLTLEAPLLERFVGDGGVVTITQDTIGQPLY